MLAAGVWLLCCPVAAGCTCSGDGGVFSDWIAGSEVTEGAVAAFGLDNCFAAEPVPEGVWTSMQGLSYIENPHIGRNDLRYLRLLHKDAEGRILLGEMVCNAAVADDLVAIFKGLYLASYPIEKMLLTDKFGADDETQMRANNTSCFCYRTIAGKSKLSKHALGLAVDINPLYNPYVKRRGAGSLFVQPANAAAYCDRDASFPYKIVAGDAACRLFAEYGFEWGGAWRTLKDYQHFELPD